jgi:ubiquinone/menaquinone biosynthesis C-methylase UbiE
MSAGPAIRRSASGVVVGNVYDKYGTKNPIARALMERFLRAVRELYASCPGRVVVELGSGEGHLLAELRPVKQDASMVGLELSAHLVRQATREHGAGPSRTAFVCGSAYAAPFRSASADVLLCCETLEHLERPEVALAEAFRILKPGGRALLSVPREPLWRALNLLRGQYLRDLGNTPGHLQHYSADGFVRQVERQGLHVIARRAPLPWTVVLAEKDRAR